MDARVSEDLFRREAIRALAERSLGRPICRVPRAWIWLTLLVISLLTFVAASAPFLDYRRSESVRGWLVAARGVATIAHSTSARVVDLRAAPGERVAAGQVLVVLTEDVAFEDGSTTSGRRIEQQRLELAALDERIALFDKQAATELDTTRDQQAALVVEKQLLDSQIGQQRERVAAAAERLASLKEAGAAVAKWDRMRQRDELGALQLQLRQLEREASRLGRERERLVADIERLPIDVALRLAELRGDRMRLMQRMTDDRARGKSVLIAPFAGIVGTVSTHVGASIRSNEALMTLLPDASQLAADVYLPSRAIGFVRAGQLVHIDYDAYPKSIFGTFAGSVEHVSDFVTLPAEAPGGFAFREAMYAVRLDVTVPQAERLRLRPGMSLSAEIVLEERDLIDWLLETLRIDA